MGLFLIEGRIPMQETINYLKKLTSIVSPTGYTKEISDKKGSFFAWVFCFYIFIGKGAFLCNKQ